MEFLVKNGVLFRDTLGMLTSLSPDVDIMITVMKNSVRFCILDKSRVYVIQATLTCKTDNITTSEDVYILSSDLKAVLTKIRKADNVSVLIGKSDVTFMLRSTKQLKTYKLFRTTPDKELAVDGMDAMSTMDKFADLKLSTSVSVSTALIKQVFSDLSDFGETINITVNKSFVQLFSNNNVGECEVTLEHGHEAFTESVVEEDIDILVTTLYVQEIMAQLSKIAPLSKFSFGKNLPMRIFVELEEGGNIIVFFAPHVDDDDDEDEYDESGED